VSWLVIAPGATRSIAAQNARLSAEVLPLDSSIRRGRLPNGFRYYVKHNRHPAHRAELRLVVRAGSLLEDDDQRGLAHLVEHMAFDGSTHFPKHAIWEYLEHLGMRGGADINAETAYDQTVYRLTVPTDSAPVIATGLTILGDIAHGLTLDSTEFARERRIVIEEWRVHRGAGARIDDRQLPVLLAGSRYAERQPLGLPSTLDRATLAAVRRFYRDWYRPDLEAVVVVGDVDLSAAENAIQATFAGIPEPAHPRHPVAASVPLRATPRVVVTTDSEATGTSVSLVSERGHQKVLSMADYRRSLIDRVSTAMLAMRLNEAARRWDAPFFRADVESRQLVPGLDVVELIARVPDGGVLPALGRLTAEADRVRRQGFTWGELKHEQAALLRWYDHIEAERHHTPSIELTEQLVREYLTGEPALQPEDDAALGRALIPTLTLAQVQQQGAALLGDAGLVILVSGPAAGRPSLPDTPDLRAALAHPDSLALYAESAADAPLVAPEPAAGSVIAVQRVDTVGVQLWTLSNGVRVLLKPTTLDPDEILVASYRDGGTSVAGDSELVPATTALPMVNASGLGPYDAAALRRHLTGMLLNVTSTIGPYGEGVSGSGSRQDAKTLFQLIYLQFTAPRIDSSAVRQFEASLRDALAHRQASPDAAYEDTLGLVLSGHSPRLPRLNDAYLTQLDPAKSLAFVRRRFADATDFTFVIVGAFDVDAIRPLVERYIGGLPASGRRNTWRDTGVRPPVGIVTRVIHKGREPRAGTTLVFLGVADSTRRERGTLLALTDVLQQRLKKRLREQLGGVYGVAVAWDQETVPCPSYRVTVTFGTDPQRLDELTNAVFTEIAELTRNGPTAAELETFTEGHRRGRETAMMTNGFWLQSLALYDQRGWPLPEIPGAERAVEGISATDLQAGARRYLDTAHYVQVSLTPEDP